MLAADSEFFFKEGTSKHFFPEVDELKFSSNQLSTHDHFVPSPLVLKNEDKSHSLSPIPINLVTFSRDRVTIEKFFYLGKANALTKVPYLPSRRNESVFENNR